MTTTTIHLPSSPDDVVFDPAVTRFQPYISVADSHTLGRMTMELTQQTVTRWVE